MEFRNLLNNVLNKAFAKFKDQLPNARIYIHNSLGSLNKAVRSANGGTAMKIGTATSVGTTTDKFTCST